MSAKKDAKDDLAVSLEKDKTCQQVYALTLLLKFLFEQLAFCKGRKADVMSVGHNSHQGSTMTAVWPALMRGL